MQAITLTLTKQEKGARKKEYKQLVQMEDTSRGVNGDTTKNKIFPKLLQHFNIEYTEFHLENFRYYLGGCIYTVSIYNGEGEMYTGHLFSTKVMSSDVLTV